MPKSKLILHNNENNPDSQSNLEQNAQKFSQQCLKVLEILNQGKKLTVANAISYGINSLPRRILDLRERNGITNIIDEWVRDGNGKRLYKQWYLNITTRPTKKLVVEKAKKSKWVQPNLL